MPIISPIARTRITLTRRKPSKPPYSVSFLTSLTPSNSKPMNKSLIYFLFSCLGLSACTKVITLNVHNSSPVYAIEGNVTDQPGPYQVKISQTVGFYANNQYPGVPGAIVTIADGAGHTDHLKDNGDGTYSTTTLQGSAGQTYTLQVLIGKDTFAATSTM